MRNRIPPLTALLTALALVGSACGDAPAETAAPAPGDSSPMSIVTTTAAPVTTIDRSTTTTAAVPGTTLPAESGRVGTGPTVTSTTAGAAIVADTPAVVTTAPVTTESIPPTPATTVPEPKTPEEETAPRSGCESADDGPNRAGECLPATTAVSTEEAGEVWRPELQEEAFEAINPWSVGVPIWYEQEEDIDTASHRFYRFYHMRGDTQAELWRHWQRALDVFWDSPIIYYPVRYDLSWHDHLKTAKVVATWPMGEKRELLVADGKPLAEIELPPGPPLPSTTPYAPPDFPETAALLGRSCPPVERLWSLDAPVSDPCTLEAVRTAFQFAFAAATPEQIQAAVRDGHVLGETVRHIKEIAGRDSFFAYWFDPANPGHYLAEARNVRWAGRFAGASMISAEYRLYALPGLAPPDMQVKARAKIQSQVEQGLDVPEWALGEELPTEPPPPEVGFWERMLVVRTADGTWRMSYPMWCDSMKSIIRFESISCPEDPNPIWSDSIWDFDLYPPNDHNFWLNATAEQKKYRGVPPS